MRRFVLPALLVLAACNPEPQSFAILEYAPGISFRALDSIAARSESRYFSCLPDVQPYRECWLRSPHTDLFIIATVDADDRVIIVRERSDTAWVKSHRTTRVGEYRAEHVRELWNRRRPPVRITVGTATIEKWTSPDGYWSGAIVTDQVDSLTYLSEIVARDERAARSYDHAREALIADSMDMAYTSARPNGAMHAMQQELLRVARAQRVYVEALGQFAPSLRALHHIPDVRHNVVIEAAGHAGWWARVRSSAAPNITCFIWERETSSAIGANVRAGTVPVHPFCRSSNVENAAQPLIAPDRAERLIRPAQTCGDRLEVVRTRDPIVGVDSSAIVQPMGIYSLVEMRENRKYGRVASLWRIGRRWLGTVETWIGEQEPLRGTLEGGFTNREVDIRFRAIHAGPFFDSFNGIVVNDALHGKFATRYRGCPGWALSDTAIVLQKDLRASEAQAKGLTVREAVNGVGP